MTYQEIKERLTQCEVKLKELHTATPAVKSSKKYNVAVEKLTVLKESLEKRLSEAEKTAFVNGQATEYTDEKELQKLKNNQDVKSIKTAGGKTIKEGMKFSKEETASIAREVGKALAKALNSMGDEIAHMKAKKIEESSFEIYVEYKNDVDDQFSFYITDDTLHLVDFSFDKELTDVGVKPSGEPVVHVDVLANELVKHFKSLQETMSDDEFADAKEGERLAAHPEKSTIEKIKALIAAEKALKEAPEGKLYIKVAVRDARKALEILNDVPAYSKAMEMDGSDTYYFDDEQLAYDAMMDLMAHGVEVTDQNVEEGWDMDEASDYAKRRAAERDYKPSKKDVPAKAFKEPKNDYFARRKAEMEEGDVDAEVDGGDLDVGHQDDEPNMLKKDLYDIMTYASKLYKQLDKYDSFDGEVDFPQWWQKKVILARDYMSAAQHYLESEEKQPAIDQLALEAKDQGASKEQETEFHKDLDTLVHKTFGKRKEELQNESVAKIQKAHELVVSKMKELAKLYKDGDHSVISQLKDLTAKKKELEKKLNKAVAGTNRNQQLDASGLDENLDQYLASAEQTIKEEKATCCGKCGRVHVKGTECKRPYLKGKDHCRYN